MDDPRAEIEHAIAALETQRDVLGDEVIAQALAPLRQRLAALQVEAGESGQAEQQLRQVTVLFSDIVGSTALSTQLDPEDLSQVMDGALRRLTRVVEAHDGRVLQYAGDSVLAVFGADGAHEDDPARAVRAGLAILEEGRLLAAAVLERHGHRGFGLRVGAHTGGVLLGGGVGGEHSIRGMTVNVAARMEQTAPPGGLRISHATYRQVRGLFVLDEQPPLDVKGGDEPLVTYLVRGFGSAAGRQALRGVDGLSAPLIGREAELELLRETGERLRAGGPPALAAVTWVAEAGLGKTRLLAEFRRRLGERSPRMRWLEAHASERGSGQPYGLLRELFAGHARILDSDTLPAARAKWSAALAALLPGEPSAGDAAVLGHLLGLDFSAHPEVKGLAGEARQLRDRGFFHAVQAFTRLAAEAAPLVLVFDDLHWADDGTLDFIEHLLAAQADLPVLLIGLSRPTLFERRPAWAAAAVAHHRRVELVPLGAAHADALAEALLRKLPEASTELRDLLTGRAEGNPFYMEELVNMLIDQGVIVTAPGPAVAAGRAPGWRFEAQRLRDLKVPGTLVGVLQARLDALPADERRTAQLAAVVGYRFWDDSLLALGVPLPASLQGLIDRELTVLQQPSSLEGMREYAFKHHTLHQVTYESVLKRIKRGIHAQVARWLMGLRGSTPLDLVAEHFERGGETALALDHWQRAAETAAARYANAEALAHAGRALALVADEELVQRYELCVLRCRVLGLQSERAQLASELDALQALVERMDDPGRLSELRVRRARYCADGGNMNEALDHAMQAVACVPEAALQRAARARATVAQCLLRLGRHDEARVHSVEALRLSRDGGDKVIEAMILNDLGMHADEQGDHGAAIGFYAEALALHRALGNRNNEGGTLSNLGYAALMLGDYVSACRQFEAARDLFASIGRRQNEAITFINLGIARLNQGRPAEALPNALQALRMLRTAGDRWSEAAALRLVGQASLALSDGPAAVANFEASRDLFEHLGMVHLALEPMAGLAAEALGRGDLGAAMAQVEAILGRHAEGVGLDGTEEPMRVPLTCHRVLAAAGDARAAKVLADAHRALVDRAARIGDATRREAYLRDVPHHREIVAAWREARSGVGDQSLMIRGSINP